MSDELEIRLANLEAKPNGNAFLKRMQIIIALSIVLVGTVTSYQITKSQVVVLTTQVAEIKEDRDKKELSWRGETDIIKKDIVKLKMKGAGAAQWRETTTESLKTIETKLDALVSKL